MGAGSETVGSQQSKSAEEFDVSWDAYIDQELAELADDPSATMASGCGFNMLIGAGTREGEKVFNTAFGLSRPSMNCEHCTGESCEDSDAETTPNRSAKESLLILRCTGSVDPSTESVAACLPNKAWPWALWMADMTR